jgi:hypothetical protein
MQAATIADGCEHRNARRGQGENEAAGIPMANFWEAIIVSLVSWPTGPTETLADCFENGVPAHSIVITCSTNHPTEVNR